MTGASSLSDIEAIEQEMPLAARLTARSTWALFEHSAAQFNRPAVSFLPNGLPDGPVATWSYAELACRARRLSNLLNAHGMARDEGVGILLPNLPEYYAAILASQARAVACPINPLLGAAALSSILGAAGCTVLIVPGPDRDAALWQRACEAVHAAPRVRLILALGGAAGMCGELAASVTVLDFDEACAQHQGVAFEFSVTEDWGAPVARFHTGGTTGAPKVAVHSQLNHVYEAWATSHLLEFRASDTVLIGLPLFHVHAAIPLGLAPLSVGAHLVLLGPQGFRHTDVVQGFWRIVERFEATVFSAVPTVYAALLALESEGARTRSLRLALCGSAPLAVGLAQRFAQRTGLHILEGYGLTEGTCVSSLNPLHGARRVGSIGLRLPYQRMKAAKLDHADRWLRDCAVGESGALLIQGPNVFGGYTDPELNSAAFAAPGWLDTGDLGTCDAQGYFWISGRAKDLIKRSGHSIDPKGIEEVLHAHESVLAAAAVGMPDDRAGELPVAYVALRPGATANEQELRGHCRMTVSDPTAVPARIFLLPALPLTAVGKIDKVRLRALAAETARTDSQGLGPAVPQPHQPTTRRLS